jgi:outer membrane protein
MKKQIFSLVLIAMFSGCTLAADLKIGVVNMKRLLTEAPQVEVISQKLQKQFSGPKKELEALAESIKKMEKDFKRDQLMMTESKLTKNKQKLVSEIKKIREMSERLNKEFQTVQNQELAVFRDVVSNVLNRLAKQEKYDLILNDGVIHASKALDMTDLILAELKKSK